jgi:hypothetical protein
MHSTKVLCVIFGVTTILGGGMQATYKYLSELEKSNTYIPKVDPRNITTYNENIVQKTSPTGTKEYWLFKEEKQKEEEKDAGFWIKVFFGLVHVCLIGLGWWYYTGNLEQNLEEEQLLRKKKKVSFVEVPKDEEKHAASESETKSKPEVKIIEGAPVGVLPYAEEKFVKRAV